MVTQVGPDSSKIAERLLWVVVFTILAAAISGYYYFSEYSILLRVLGLLLCSGIVIGLVFKTSFGRSIWMLWLEAVQEVKRMHWPTRQETVQTTLAVMAMVVVMGILLWTADFVLLRVVKWLTGHWGV